MVFLVSTTVFFPLLQFEIWGKIEGNDDMISSCFHINVEFESCQIKFEYLPQSQLLSDIWYSFDIWKYFFVPLP